MTKKRVCIAKLPHAGLANKLFIWSQALIFSEINNCPFYSVGWAHLHMRTLFKIFLKIERRHEYYFSPFQLRPPVPMLVQAFFLKKIFLKQENCDKVFKGEGLYIFHKMHAPHDYFYILKDHRKLIKERFFKYLKPSIQKEISKAEIPIIGVHVRKGDFEKMSFKTPVDYYIDIIDFIRKFIDYPLPITIFTDANENDIDIKRLLALSHVKLAIKSSAIVDLVTLSKSRIIVVSPHSTFGRWASFLSESIIIDYTTYTGEKIRDEETNTRIYEGKVPLEKGALPPILVKNLLDLKKELYS